MYYFRFRATLYPCPETPQERKEMLAGVNARIDDLQMVRKKVYNSKRSGEKMVALVGFLPLNSDRSATFIYTFY